MIGPDEVLAAAGMVPARLVERANGYDAQVWRVESAGRSYAVRVLRPDRPVDDEIAMMRLARELGHPAPRVVANGTLDGRSWVITDWCEGRTIGQSLIAGHGSPCDLGILLGRAHARLHEPMKGRPDVLCHLDFQPFNVLARDGAVTGIVDWSNARIGDRRDDIAWTAVVLQLAPAVVPDAPPEAVGALTDGWREGYALVRPMPPDDELRGALRWAAQAQLVPWQERLAAGEPVEAITAAARAIARQWASA